MADLSYSDAGAELDAIIEEFETGVIDVDRLVEQLQRATDIVDELDRRLRRTRMQVEELVPRLESIGRNGRRRWWRSSRSTIGDGGRRARFGLRADDGGERPPGLVSGPGSSGPDRPVSGCCAPSRPSRAARSSRLSTLPDGLRGRASTKSTEVGHL